MMVKVTCPSCSAAAKVPRKHLGRKVTCPRCRNEFVLVESEPDQAELVESADEQAPVPPVVRVVPAQEVTPKPDKKKQVFSGALLETKEAEPSLIESYGVVYKGGHPDYPKEKGGKIHFKVFNDRFELLATMGTKRWFSGLVIPYRSISSLEIVERQVGTVEGLLGGLNSRQLNQANNIHISYQADDGQEVLLRLEMLSGVTVMGQAKKCLEFMDRLRTHRIFEKFRGKRDKQTEGHNVVEDIPTQLEKLAALRDRGILTAEEFARKKTELLSRM